MRGKRRREHLIAEVEGKLQHQVSSEQLLRHSLEGAVRAQERFGLQLDAVYPRYHITSNFC